MKVQGNEVQESDSSMELSSLGRKFAGVKVPWRESSLELSLPGVKVPGNESSREQKFHGTFAPGIESSRELTLTGSESCSEHS